jgi:radical SAM superfamily enzyme YgiQ (UPF0313 family)
VLGFDGDDKSVFERTAGWVEENRLECATFHILTPYPGTPLFRQMEREGRLLHRDWEKYDTAHVVFRPAKMSVEELQLGYDWLYRRLFSLKSIWARRPTQPAAVLPYMAMSLLYKRSNRLWRLLIKHRLAHAVWSPLVQLTRWRHVRFRKRLARRFADGAGQFGCRCLREFENALLPTKRRRPGPKPSRPWPAIEVHRIRPSGGGFARDQFMIRLCLL